MKTILQSLCLLLLPVFLNAQNINWEDVSSSYEFPAGLKLFEGSVDGNPGFSAWYFEVDMNQPDIAIRPYLISGTEQVDDFSGQVGAYGAINGGFFTTGASVSSVVYPGQVLARNLISLTRTVDGVTQTYPVIRPIFALNHDRSLSAEWVYHHSYNFEDIYVYNEPLQYECNDPDPLPVPVKAEGYQYEDIAYGLGGGPMLVKDGEIAFTYCEGIWWGSGVDLNVNRPRTAVGYTQDNKVIMLVVNSLKIEDLPALMLDLGCYEAINLDGGGSTAMAVGNTSIYDQNRAVPSILAVVHTDSLNIPAVPTYEKFIDTGDEGVTSQGSDAGWFQTENQGYWGSPSMLHAISTHNDYYKFPLNLPIQGEYEIYSWWTSHPNRAADTPYFITHADGITEVAVNQSIAGSMWNLIGTFQFNGTPDENVRITAGATTNQYVVADAIRVVSYDPQFAVNNITNIDPVDDISVPQGTSKEDALSLLSTHTTITDSFNQEYEVELQWSSDDYDGDIPGNYQALGVFELPEGVEQTDPPTPLEVTAAITVEEGTDINELSKHYVNVYPNPSEGRFTLEGNLQDVHYAKVFSLDVRLIYEQEIQGLFNVEINLQAYARGIYMLRISGNHYNQVHRIVIR
ncbi:MAG: phosphodiester glycosidase family protein [Bacteroidales bacterium]